MQTHKSSISKYLLALAALILLIVVLMGFKTPEPYGGFSNVPTTHTVTIFRMKYNPAHLTVKKGDTVIWINKDFVPHDVTEELSHKWTSKPFNKGEKWSKVINEDVDYFCNLHKVMKGTIRLDN